VDVFIIHSGADKAIVEKKLDKLCHKSFDLNVLLLKNGGIFWRLEAGRKIRKAQMVIFYVGEHSWQSPNIGWELREAAKYGKQIFTIKLDAAYQIHPKLEDEDPFSGQKKRIDREIGEEELLRIVERSEKGEYDIFNQELEQCDMPILLEQYKIFLQTSESLIDRRQSVNNFYISVNSALAATYGAILALSEIGCFKLMVSFIFFALGVFLCAAWMNILSSYGDLNGSKMKIISQIEKRLPANLYDAEWEALSDKLKRKKYVSFTESEKSTPKLFIALYCLLFLLCILSASLQ